MYCGMYVKAAFWMHDIGGLELEPSIKTSNPRFG